MNNSKDSQKIVKYVEEGSTDGYDLPDNLNRHKEIVAFPKFLSRLYHSADFDLINSMHPTMFGFEWNYWLDFIERGYDYVYDDVIILMLEDVCKDKWLSLRDEQILYLIEKYIEIQIYAAKAMANISTPSTVLSNAKYEYIAIKRVRYSINQTSLSLSDMSLDNYDIVQLEHMTNLTKLCLNRNKISNLRPLANLTSLTHLSLSHNQIVDISFLSGLTNLKCLDLDANKIKDISPLNGMTHLTGLFLHRNPITDWSPVAHMQNVHGRP